jgi:hypothetical protein
MPFFIFGCGKSETTPKIQETESISETTPPLENTNVTISDIAKMSDLESIFNNNNSISLHISEYNTQESDLFELTSYLEYISDTDFTYAYSDSDGYVIYQTPYYTYSDVYGDTSCNDGAVVQADEIIDQIQSVFLPVFYNGTINGEYTVNNDDNSQTTVVSITCSAQDFHDFSTAWSYDDGEFTANYKLDENKKILLGIDIFYLEDKIMTVQIDYNTMSDEVSDIFDRAMNYFNKNKENESLFVEK